MSAPLEGLESHPGAVRESPAAVVGHVGVIFRVKHQNLRRCDFISVVPRIVEGAASELPPIRIGKPITIAKRLADVLCVVFFGGFHLFGSIQNLPVHYGTICDHPLDPWVKGCKDCCRAPEASSDDEDLIWRKAEAPTECNFFKFIWQIVDDVEDILMGRLLQKVSVAFPRSAIAWINYPKTLRSEEFR